MTDWNNVRHFTRDEFRPRGAVEPDEELVTRLDVARQIAGVPFVINSAIRTKVENYQAGGVKGSAHLTGKAVDIACGSSGERFLILKALLSAGFERIGIGETFIHADVDASKPPNVVWLYSRSEDA